MNPVANPPEDRAVSYASWDACTAHTEAWLQAQDIGQLRRVVKGTQLYFQGLVHEHFYLIREGYVHTEMVHDSGRRLILEVIGPGAMFGEGAAFDGLPRFVSAVCATDAVLSVYSKADVLGAGGRSVTLLESLVKVLSSKQRILARKMLQFTCDAPELRVMQLLGRVVGVHQRQHLGGGGGPLRVNLSQDQIADICGMSRVSAARALRRLASEGVVRRCFGFLEVLDAQALQPGPTDA